MSFLTLRDVSKSYGATLAVAPMHLTVQQGEFVSLLGPSGCGKTTTLQMVAGFEAVSSGQILLAGRDITHASPNSRGLGIVFQSYALFPHMTVQANVRFGLEMRRLPRAECDARVRDALGLVHLQALADRYPRELSGGQRQRVALARALVIAPPVLLLDEPLSNLDAKLREEMQFELRQIQRQVGTTTIMVTHDQSEALSVSDRVVIMQAGHVQQVDVPQRVYEHPASRFISTFVGKANLLDAQVQHGGSATRIAIGSVHCDVPVEQPAAFRTGDRAVFSLRPEKLQLRPRGQGRLDAELQERFFLGSQWLYRLASDAGDWTVLSPNDGRLPLAVGDWAGLDWPDHCARLLPAEGAA